MREILFRGKHINSGNWIYGHFVHQYGADMIYLPEGVDSEFGFDYHYITHGTLGQYTGLTDKHGKKIFEGDIIKQIFRLKQTNGSLEREIISVVEYGISYAYSDVCGVCQRFSDGSGIAMLSVMGTRGIVDCEVIGNIHDNPELLKGE